MERKKVDQYSLDGKFIATYNSIASAAKALHRDPRAVFSSCKGLCRNCGGYVLRYHGESFSNPLIKNETDNELWKAIPGYEGYYEVSSFGEVRSVDRLISRGNGVFLTRKGKYVAKSIRTDGYYVVCFHKNGIKKSPAVHRLVASAFIPNPKNLPCIDHIDGNRLNNNVSNLRWCTSAENNSFPLACKRKSEHWNPATRKPVLVYDKGGNLIGRFISIKEASIHTKVHDTTISSILHGKRKNKNYNFKFENNADN